ncbi:hypothetical protein HPB50_013337 [Hyalomma asiaticum]|uniref:Uncharacterized protein n=1 Tax=Hyalomma asiaticum TaxID=266040 RepID=A0ACB7SF61_HYAAI|nr:hypothetical protein HPB50_013337 [Hyalomma asiaticum]
MMQSPGEGGVPPSSPTDAVAIECPVTWNDWKKVISVSGKEKCYVIGALSNTDFRSALEGGHMEAYNTRFGEYVEVPEGFIFSDGDRIRLVSNTEGNDCTLLQLSPNPEPTMMLVPDFTDSRPSSSAEKVYSLPPTPLGYSNRFYECEARGSASRLKMRIVSWIANNLMTVSLYPRGLYDAAAKALLLKYPQVTDTIGTGHDSWKVLFRYKLGNIRKSLEPTPVIKMAREKFGKKAATTKHNDGQARRTCHVVAARLRRVMAMYSKFEVVQDLFNLAKSRRLVRQYASRIEEELLTMAGDAKKYHFAVGVLELLPLLLKEKAFFFKEPQLDNASRHEKLKTAVMCQSMWRCMNINNFCVYEAGMIYSGCSMHLADLLVPSIKKQVLEESQENKEAEDLENIFLYGLTGVERDIHM